MQCNNQTFKFKIFFKYLCKNSKMFQNVSILFTILVYYTCKIMMTNLKEAGHGLFLI